MFGGLVRFEAPSINYYYLALGVVFVCLLILYHFERAYMNFQWRMIKDDSTLAGATGVNVIGTKIVNFTISAFMAGIAGALVASYQGNLGAGATTRFATTASITLLVYMVVGGRGRFVGPIIGTAVMMVLDELARPMGNSRPILTGAIAIAVMIFMPMGLVGLPAQIREQGRKRRVKLLDKAVRSD
jgi:branched-chain amino acid transport system permease protein